MDIFVLSATTWIVLLNITEASWPSINFQRSMASFIILCQASRFVLDWMKLFDITSFYVTLIIKTAEDIVGFSIVIIALLFYIGATMAML